MPATAGIHDRQRAARWQPPPPGRHPAPTLPRKRERGANVAALQLYNYAQIIVRDSLSRFSGGGWLAEPAGRGRSPSNT